MTGQENPTNKKSETSDTPVLLAEHFTRSEKFNELFAHGMDLVEETASFLDSEGRAEAKHLPKSAQAMYGTESMRLTTRLMQLASWLLLQRAVAEGEMTVEQALTEKKNVKLNQLHSEVGGPGWSQMPEKFVHLVEGSIRLQRRIKRLDSEIYEQAPVNPDKVSNPVAAQQDLLQTAFDPQFNK